MQAHSSTQRCHSEDEGCFGARSQCTPAVILGETLSARARVNTPALWAGLGLTWGAGPILGLNPEQRLLRARVMRWVLPHPELGLCLGAPLPGSSVSHPTSKTRSGNKTGTRPVSGTWGWYWLCCPLPAAGSHPAHPPDPATPTPTP